MKTPKAWGEILNAIERQATIILEVLDARDPEGTRPHAIEEHVQKKCPGKKLILVLNKADLIPEDVLQAWVRYYQDLGFLCFHVSALRKDGITFLMSQMMRYVDRELGNKILVVGYPNTGKSSIITALLKEKKIARKSPEAGFTRGLQLLKLPGWHNMYLLDTPGVVPFNEEEAELTLALKGAIKISKIENPQAVVEEIYRRGTPEKLKEVYNVIFTNIDEFVQALGRKRGRLKKGNEVNEPEVWMIIIRDWQRNVIPYYTTPPNYLQQ
ncbi:MAG: HSR1-like GTP-binding protein [Promethearchaeota archaeon CR_4]|nr:MAG: HSR1-like GTP-binding protein [Candidatus Lokiarchaeota archaeon CR_4]